MVAMDRMDWTEEETEQETSCNSPDMRSSSGLQWDSESEKKGIVKVGTKDEMTRSGNWLKWNPRKGRK